MTTDRPSNGDTGRVQTARHLEILRREGALLASVPADSLGAPVPTVEGWDVERVLRHTGKVHQWATGALRLPPTSPLSEIAPLAGIPAGPDCLPAYREALDALVAELEARDPAEEAATFVGVRDVAWWARRQAQEVSVHRVDAQDGVHAAGGPAPDDLAADGAADGIDEWARLFLPRRPPTTLEGASVHIHGTDDPAPADGAEWLLSFGADSFTVEATHAKGDVALRGPAADLLLVLWRRRPLDLVDTVGDRTVAERLLDAAAF